MLDAINQFIAQPLARKILFFDEMLTPSLMRLAYWLGLLAIVWTGLKHMFSNGFFGFFEGGVYIAIGVIVLRVVSEVVMLLFKLDENMKAVAANTGQGLVASAPVKRKTTRKTTKKTPK